jgi:hypothetical protein
VRQEELDEGLWSSWTDASNERLFEQTLFRPSAFHRPFITRFTLYIWLYKTRPARVHHHLPSRNAVSLYHCLPLCLAQHELRPSLHQPMKPLTRLNPNIRPSMTC